jgi:acyl-CoA reductase-like NAD-dependent aldehyde dehydrogenase
MWFIVPALLTGNTVVFKPSEHAQEVSKRLNELLIKVFPEGIIITVFGDSKAGKELVKSDIDKLFFTGSVEAGYDIQRNIGIKPCDMELGGKDSAIVCSDTDMDLAVKGVVWGAINNCGQVCNSTERVYVHEKIAKEFTERLVSEVRKLRVGKDFGPLVNKQQLDKVEAHVKNAVSGGAKILVGGKRIDRDGYFIEPTVLANVNEDMDIMRNETFGPVIPIKSVKSEEEAVKLANESNFGLGVVIWTKDLKKGKKLGDKINVGMVWINDANVPFSGGDYWGGVKESGLRSSQSKIMQFVKAKSFITYSGKDEREWWYPYK